MFKSKCTSMKMGSLVEVGLLLQRPSLAMAEMSDSILLPKMSTEGGVMLKPGRVGPLEPGGACHSSSRGLSGTIEW